MMRIGAAAFLALVCVLPAQAAEDDLFNRETLTGDWGGARSGLAQAGIVLDADEILDMQADASGGRGRGGAFNGRLELYVSADLGAVLGWDGAILHANAYQIHGRGLSADEVGNLMNVSNVAADPSTRLFTLWLQQSLFDDTLSIRAGQIAADDEFFASQYAALFINSAFGWPSVLGINLPSGGPAYALATPGIRVRLALSPALVLSSALFNGDPAPPGAGKPEARDPSGTSFRLDANALWISELAYSANLALGGDQLPGTYKLGGWYHDGPFDDQHLDGSGLSLADPLSDGIAARHRGNFGGYVIIDQLLLRDGGSSDRGLGAFLRAGAAPGDRNLIQFHVDAGLTYTGLLAGRDDDVAGLGVSYEQIGEARAALSADIAKTTGQAAADYEAIVEFSYQGRVAPWWVVQPDLQIVLHPGARLTGAAGDAVVVGARTAISL
jgi:porin